MRPVALVGMLSEFQLVNVVALLQVERKTGELTLQNDEQQTVRLYVQDGRVVHVESNTLRGPNAPSDGFELALTPFTWAEGKFHFEQYDLQVPQPNITQGNSALVMEGRNRAASARELQQSVPSGAIVLRLLHTPGQNMKSINLDFMEWRFLTMVDGERDVQAIAEMLGMDDLRGRQVASRMLKNDLVERVDLRQKMHRLHAFTGEDSQSPEVAAMDDLALDVLTQRAGLAGEPRLDLLTDDELRRETMQVAGLQDLGDRLLLAPLTMAKLNLSNGDPIYVRLRD